MPPHRPSPHLLSPASFTQAWVTGVPYGRVASGFWPQHPSGSSLSLKSMSPRTRDLVPTDNGRCS